MDEKQKITVPMTESDLQDVLNGDTFDWTFEDQNGKLIDVHVRPQTEEDE